MAPRVLKTNDEEVGIALRGVGVGVIIAALYMVVLNYTKKQIKAHHDEKDATKDQLLNELNTITALVKEEQSLNPEALDKLLKKFNTHRLHSNWHSALQLPLTGSVSAAVGYAGVSALQHHDDLELSDLTLIGLALAGLAIVPAYTTSAKLTHALSKISHHLQIKLSTIRLPWHHQKISKQNLDLIQNATIPDDQKEVLKNLLILEQAVQHNHPTNKIPQLVNFVFFAFLVFYAFPELVYFIAGDNNKDLADHFVNFVKCITLALGTKVGSKTVFDIVLHILSPNPNNSANQSDLEKAHNLSEEPTDNLTFESPQSLLDDDKAPSSQRARRTRLPRRDKKDRKRGPGLFDGSPSDRDTERKEKTYPKPVVHQVDDWLDLASSSLSN